MRITHTDIYQFPIPMEPFTIATGTMDYAQNTLIKIHTDSGLTGLGECSAFPMIAGETMQTCFIMAREFAAIIKGKDPLQIDDRLDEIQAFAAFNATIKSAFDMALFDLAAKEKHLPLYQFLGGSPRPIETDLTIGIGSPEWMAARARDFVEKGVSIIKIKLGKEPVEDIRRIELIRQAAGPNIRLRIDANQGWSFDGAVLALQSLAAFDIEFCEQPIHHHLDHLLPALKKLSPIPIMADESVFNHHDADRLIAADACTYINIKFAKSGGIREAQKICASAAAAKMPCMMGGMLESRLALSAKLHFVYSQPIIQFYDMDTPLLGHLQDPITGGAQYQGYTLHLPHAPGHGADVSKDFLQECEHIRV